MIILLKTDVSFEQDALMQIRCSFMMASMQNENLFPFKKSLLWVALSVLVITGIPIAFYLTYRLYEKARFEDPSHTITHWKVQASAPYSLDEAYIIQLCGYAPQQHVHYYQLPLQKIQTALHNCVWIKKAHLRREAKNTLVIGYENRYPIAKIAHQKNMALSDDGKIIPYQPFFRSLDVPILVFPKEWSAHYGEALHIELEQTVREIFHDLGAENIAVLDIQGLHTAHFGEKEIKVYLKKEAGGHLLRLNAYDYLEGLAKYRRLLQEGLDRWSSYDLRIAQIALVE